jgi:eukaryotic-like serine/threonine-protein kinase
MESLIGKTVDDYLIMEVIARGGMGVVFKAMDTNLEKVVAIKMIDPFLARDVNFVKRFKTEAKALAKLENSRIVTVHALRETEEGLFMVMEYVDSKSLSTILKESGPLNLKDTINIVEQMLDALAHAHNAGIIHRDIKPGNILVCENGKVKVTDFGLAKVAQQRGGANTVTQTVAGTLYYMSPEQIKGLKNVDKRSDIYSLGITLYEMMAGRIPFDKTDSDFSIQKAIVDGEIPSPAKFNAGIPKKLLKIITKSIDKDPDKRYQTAEEMIHDIEIFKNEIAEVKKEKKSVSKFPVWIYPLAVIPVLVLIYFMFLSGSGSGEKYYLNLTSIPSGADVLVNENVIGKTPLNSFVLEGESSINIRLSKDGFAPIDTILSATDSMINGSFILVKYDVEHFSISTNPVGANLYINNSSIGSSPVSDFSYRQGEHNFKIEKAGYLTIDTIIKIDRGFAGTLNFNLQKSSIPVTETIAAAGTKTPVLFIATEPPDASVSINGEAAGNTPYVNNKFAAGSYKIVIKKKGYRDISETIKISLKDTTKISRKLNPSGTLIVKSDPSGAQVFIDNKLAGKTPYTTDQVTLGQHTIDIVKPGFKKYSSKTKIEAETTLSQKLEKLNGKIEVSVKPLGTIYLDGQLKTKDASTTFTMDVPGGTHKLKVTHPSLGTYEKEINITEETPYIININLNRIVKLAVVSSPLNCEILLNGKSTNQYTPSQLKLAPGNYKISLKKDGYSSSPEISYNVPSQIFEEPNDREDRQEFTLEKK